jgi:type II secretory pathway pseudopilin PulG
MKRYFYRLLGILEFRKGGRITSDDTSQAATQMGFTIVELMIATVVFSMVMMVIVYGVLNFSHDYYDGITASTTQNTARNIINSITQSIEFSGMSIVSTPASLPGAGSEVYLCAGGSTYAYNWGTMYTGTVSATNLGLYEITGTCQMPTASSIAAAQSNGSGKELLNPNMRVTVLTVASDSTGRLYTVTLGVAYGDSDLLCNQSKTGQGGCVPTDTENPMGRTITTNPSSVNNVSDVECRDTAGFEFCAHAGLSTTVALRVASGVLN